MTVHFYEKTKSQRVFIECNLNASKIRVTFAVNIVTIIECENHKFFILLLDES